MLSPTEWVKSLVHLIIFSDMTSITLDLWCVLWLVFRKLSWILFF